LFNLAPNIIHPMHFRSAATRGHCDRRCHRARFFATLAGERPRFARDIRPHPVVGEMRRFVAITPITTRKCRRTTPYLGALKLGAANWSHLQRDEAIA
jgi:hypothetical protein